MLSEPQLVTKIGLLGKEVIPTRYHNLRPPWVDLGLPQRSGTWTGKYSCCVVQCYGHICLRLTGYKSFDR